MLTELQKNLVKSYLVEHLDDIMSGKLPLYQAFSDVSMTEGNFQHLSGFVRGFAAKVNLKPTLDKYFPSAVISVFKMELEKEKIKKTDDVLEAENIQIAYVSSNAYKEYMTQFTNEDRNGLFKILINNIPSSYSQTHKKKSKDKKYTDGLINYLLNVYAAFSVKTIDMKVIKKLFSGKNQKTIVRHIIIMTNEINDMKAMDQDAISEKYRLTKGHSDYVLSEHRFRGTYFSLTTFAAQASIPTSQFAALKDLLTLLMHPYIQKQLALSISDTLKPRNEMLLTAESAPSQVSSSMSSSSTVPILPSHVDGQTTIPDYIVNDVCVKNVGYLSLENLIHINHESELWYVHIALANELLRPEILEVFAQLLKICAKAKLIPSTPQLIQVKAYLNDFVSHHYPYLIDENTATATVTLPIVGAETPTLSDEAISDLQFTGLNSLSSNSDTSSYADTSMSDSQRPQMSSSSQIPLSIGPSLFSLSRGDLNLDLSSVPAFQHAEPVSGSELRRELTPPSPQKTASSTLASVTLNDAIDLLQTPGDNDATISEPTDDEANENTAPVSSPRSPRSM